MSFLSSDGLTQEDFAQGGRVKADRWNKNFFVEVMYKYRHKLFTRVEKG